jgi:putative transposase
LDGALGLMDCLRAPLSNPRSLREEMRAALIAVRYRHPSWGPRKVKAWLETHQPDIA